MNYPYQRSCIINGNIIQGIAVIPYTLKLWCHVALKSSNYYLKFILEH